MRRKEDEAVQTAASADEFLREYMATTEKTDVNDMSGDRLHNILSSMRQLTPDDVNQTQLKIELLLIKL